MRVILRKLSQKRHWDNAPWLERGDMQADVTKCLATGENKLSVFVLDEPNEQVERVVAALAVMRENLAQLDPAVAPEGILEECGIQWASTQGKTPDFEVNEWHQDLIKLTIAKITRLAVAIKLKGQIKRYNYKQVAEAIKHSLDANYIGAERMGRNLAHSPQKRIII